MHGFIQCNSIRIVFLYSFLLLNFLQVVVTSQQLVINNLEQEVKRLQRKIDNEGEPDEDADHRSDIAAAKMANSIHNMMQQVESVQEKKSVLSLGDILVRLAFIRPGIAFQTAMNPLTYLSLFALPRIPECFGWNAGTTWSHINHGHQSFGQNSRFSRSCFLASR